MLQGPGSSSAYCVMLICYYSYVFVSFHDQSHLASLLKTAEDLRIKGLAEVSWRQEGQPAAPSNEDEINCVDPQVSRVESVGNSSDLEPPLKRRRGRPPLETNVSSFSPKVASVTGAGGTEEVFIVSVTSSMVPGETAT